MDYRCPECKTDLKYRRLPSKWNGSGDKKLFGIRVPRVLSCPDCGVLLAYAHEQQDQKLMWYLLGPFVFGFLALVSENEYLQILSAIVFVTGVAYLGYQISKPSYKNKPYYQVYKNR